MRFVQFADSHLSFSGAVAAELRSAFERACKLAVDRKADVVLLPGDLFDYETADPDTTAFMTRMLGDIAPIPVYIAPGNHDSLRPASPYFGEWPGNVHIFTEPRFESVMLADMGCSITGIAHAHRGITDRLLADAIPAPDAGTRILLVHGSRDGYRPSGKENVIPFSDSELLAQGFTYAAIGHYHSFATISDDSGSARAAYSGCLQGRGLDETGVKCALVGEIDSQGRVELEQVEVAQRRVVRVDVDVSGSRNSDEIFARIDAEVSKQAQKQDIVYAFAKGTLPVGLEIDTSAWESRQACFRASLNISGIEPDYDLEAMARDSAASTLRSAFVRRMLERQNRASDEERLVLRDAMIYGLSALDGRRLRPRDVD
jgi:exonuclease SbcD